MFRKVLAAGTRVLGDEHPDTLTTANNLATALNRQGNLSEAETTFKHVLRVRLQVNGEEHPDTLTSFTNLACTLVDQAKHMEAASVWSDVLTVQKRARCPSLPSSQPPLATKLIVQKRARRSVFNRIFSSKECY
jgi:hypothetical protein